jgi:glycosyltransferase involved in cell wall biosynthesis
MKIVAVLATFSMGGTEKAAITWLTLLRQRGHEVGVIALENGPRKSQLDALQIETKIAKNLHDLRKAICDFNPDVIHAHCPGFPHRGDILGKALTSLPKKIPCVQTNIFGRLENPSEDLWTDFRLYISWASSVQAARRSGKKLDRQFFQRQSVAVYPVEDPFQDAPREKLIDLGNAFREEHSIPNDSILFGRFSRPEPNKWTELALKAFQLASRQNPRIKLLLREPPHHVASTLKKRPDFSHYLILPLTSDKKELTRSQMACDAILHTSSIGESFGYGIAEPMALGKPILTHSIPWLDQAQVELVRHGVDGLIASTPQSLARAILTIANNSELRAQFGESARTRILTIASPQTSITRLETCLVAATQKKDNPFWIDDIATATATAKSLDIDQWGHYWSEALYLRVLSLRKQLGRIKRKLIFNSKLFACRK